MVNKKVFKLNDGDKRINMDKKEVNFNSNNQLLTILVILAVIFSVSGFLISLSKIKTMEITGLATTQTGAVNVSATSAQDITLIVNQVNFGSLGAGSTNNTLDEAPLPFQLQNDGNVCVNITIERTQTSWITGSVQGGNLSRNNNTMFNTTCSTPLKCRTGHRADNGTGAGPYELNLNTTWLNITQGHALKAIVGLNFSDASDDAEVEILVHVPADEAAGNKNTSITFTASDSGLC